jgi:uncharacterized protein YecE (DUF72 family)
VEAARRGAGAAHLGRNAMGLGRCRVGCSGWQYDHWRGNFYPRRLPQGAWLEHYATVFDTVEVNTTFYRLPDKAVFSSWGGRVPGEFRFALKASRYLTHRKRLRQPREALRRFFSRASVLQARLGPVLYQLPPGWRKNLDRLTSFLRALPAGYRHTVEFRDGSWYAEDVFEALERSGVALCLHDLPGSASPRVSIGPFVYVRFHGPGGRYGGRYPIERLSSWVKWLRKESRAGRDVYIHFNNDVGGNAPRDARRLKGMLDRA